jgi:REP element-mobilizing transposase RayT
MDGIYSQCYIHFVFAVKFKNAAISQEWRESLHKYITGITHNNGHKLMAINSMPDHVHMLVGYNVTQAVAEFMRLVKGTVRNLLTKINLHLSNFIGKVAMVPFQSACQALIVMSNTLLTRISTIKRFNSGPNI